MQQHTKFARRELNITRDILEPLTAEPSLALRGPQLSTTLLIIRLQSNLDISLALKVLSERDRILNRQPRALPGREMGSMSAISGEDDLAVVPALIGNIPEAQPPGISIIVDLPHEAMALELIFKELFEESEAVTNWHPIEAQ